MPAQSYPSTWQHCHRYRMTTPRRSFGCLSWTLLAWACCHCQAYTVHLPQKYTNRQRQRPFLTQHYYFAKPPSPVLEDETNVDDAPRQQKQNSPTLDYYEENKDLQQDLRGRNEFNNIPEEWQQAHAPEGDDGEEEADEIISRHGKYDENDSYDDRYLAMEQESEMTRRKWLQQTGAIFLGSSALVGTSMMTSKLQQKIQRQQQAEELFQTSEQAFIRLEPYPSRRRKQNNRQPIIEASNNATAVTGTSLGNKNQTSKAVSAKSSNVTTAPKTKANNATTTGASLNNTSSAGSKSQKSISGHASKPVDTNKSSMKKNDASTSSTKELAPVNFTKVAAENTINITLKDCSNGGCTQINGTSFQKIKIPDQQKQAPFTRFLPPFLRPAAPQTVIKDIPDSEIILAATVAGSIIEMVRTTLLYPLSTVKTRIQARQQEQQKSKESLRRNMERLNASSSTIRPSRQQKMAVNVNQTANATTTENSAIPYDLSSLPSNQTMNLSATTNNNKTSYKLSPQASKGVPPKSKRKKTETSLRRRLRVLQLNIRRHTTEGNLYAGLLPSLLVSVPATGVYYSVRDVTKRALSVSDGLLLDDAIITLLGALNADVISLMIRTPADALAARLQAAAASQPSAPKASTSRSDAESEAPTSANASVADSLIQENNISSSIADDFIPKTVLDAPLVVPGMQANESDAEEVWFREEAAHYMNKESDMVVNSTHTIDALFASVLPGEYDHEEQFLLLQLQRQEYSMKDLMDGLYKEPKEKPTGMSKRQLKRLRRNTARRHKKYGMREGNNGRNIDAHPHYIQDFVDTKEQTGGGNLDSQTLLKVSTAIDDWGTKLEKIRIARSMPPIPDDIVMAEQDTSGELDSGKLPADEDAIEMMAENATMAPENSNGEKPTVARMDDKEERQLVQDLQEKNVYDEAWFPQSLERLPAIIITDLPYLLSRIALNRIIIHGKVNIGQYEVQTIAIAMFCALLTTPFDVVRTRLLVDNDDPEESVLGDDSIGAAANTTIVTADGNVLLVDSNSSSTNIDAAVNARSQGGVLDTMISIAKEGDGGVRNLYAGWLERTAYYGIGRAWLDPINIITYVGIRDTLLLQWFD